MNSAASFSFSDYGRDRLIVIGWTAQDRIAAGSVAAPAAGFEFVASAGFQFEALELPFGPAL